MKRAIRWLLVGLSLLIVTTVAAAVWLWNDPASAFRLAMVAGQTNAGLTERTTEIDGRTWRFLDSEAPLPRNALVLHGLGTSAEAMMTIAPILRETHRVVIPDLPGFGEHAVHGTMAHDATFYIDAIESFAADVAHELKNPLTSLGSALEMMERTTDPESHARLMRIARGIGRARDTHFHRAAGEHQRIDAARA